MSPMPDLCPHCLGDGCGVCVALICPVCKRAPLVPVHYLGTTAAGLSLMLCRCTDPRCANHARHGRPPPPT